MSTKTDWIDLELNSLKQQGLYNTIRTIESPQGAWITVDGKPVRVEQAFTYLAFHKPRGVLSDEQARPDHPPSVHDVVALPGHTSDMTGLLLGANEPRRASRAILTAAIVGAMPRQLFGVGG